MCFNMKYINYLKDHCKFYMKDHNLCISDLKYPSIILVDMFLVHKFQYLKLDLKLIMSYLLDMKGINCQLGLNKLRNQYYMVSNCNFNPYIDLINKFFKHIIHLLKLKVKYKQYNQYLKHLSIINMLSDNHNIYYLTYIIQKDKS